MPTAPNPIAQSLDPKRAPARPRPTGARPTGAALLALAALLSSACSLAFNAGDLNDQDQGRDGGGAQAREGGTGGRTGGAEPAEGDEGGEGGEGGTFGGGTGGDATSGVLADIVINEIFHNPPGEDAGCFIELSGPPNAPLAGYRLELLRGAEGSALEVFRFTSDHRLGPSGFFVLAQDRGVEVDEDASVAVINGGSVIGPDLPNTANTLSLVFDDEAVDSVAYSEAIDGECPSVSGGEGLGCAFTPPASDGDPALSLSRDPAGRDTDDNATDFAPAPPTPGAINQSF